MATMDPNEQKNAFSWEECAARDQEERIQIKENNVSVGLEYAEKIAAALQPTIKHAADSTDDLMDTILNTSELTYITSDIDTCNQKNKSFSCQLGLLGNTGAGKTSFLNAMIDCQESLPSNSVQAGTASVCKISYNYDDDPRSPSRAEISLQDAVSIGIELDRYFGIIQEIKEAKDDDKNGDSLEHIEDLKAQTQNMASKINMIWGLKQEEFQSMSTQQLLNDFPKVRKLLGKKIHLRHEDRESFFKMVRPYLDSTKADHCFDGREFCIWPLVEVVEIYIQDEFLKHGITLVDLPGYGDTNQSRVEVTRKYFDQLDLVAVLTPSVRAAHDKKSLDLLDGPLKRAMQMDGKYKENTFAIVIGKVDDINCQSFLESSAKKDHECVEIVGKLKEAEEKVTELWETRGDYERELKGIKAARTELNKLRKLKGATYIRESKDSKILSVKRAAKDATKKYGRVEKSLEETKNLLEKSKERLEHCESHQTFYCIRERSKIHENKLKSYFRRTQAELSRKAKRTDYDGEISIFPTSSTAYWKLKNLKNGETTPPGFPSVNYTGIPAFKAWVNTASIPMREEHSDHILNQLQGILETAKAYSSGDTGKLSGDYDKEKLKSEFRSSTEVKLREGLRAVFAFLLDEAKKIKELQSDPETEEGFKERCRLTVHSWSFQFQEANNKSINWKTYEACLRRKGQAFDSRTKNGEFTYEWIQDLTAIFVDYIKEEWDEKLNDQLPNLHRRTGMAREWDQTWDSFFERVATAVQNAAPSSSKIIEIKTAALRNVKQQMNDRVSAALKSESEASQSTRDEIPKIIARKMKMTFLQAFNITGRGSFQQRKEILRDFAKNRLGQVFREVRSSTSAELNKKIRGLKNELDKIISEAVTKSMRILESMILSDEFVTMNNIEMKNAVSERNILQGQIGLIVTEWVNKWQSPDGSISIQKKSDSFRIPNRFSVKDDEEEDEEMDEFSDTAMEDLCDLISEDDQVSGEECNIKDETMGDA